MHMNNYLKTSLIYWPLAIGADAWLSNLGIAVFKNPEGKGFLLQNLGFPISLCYQGPFPPPGQESLSGPCTDLQPLVYNILINLGLAVIVFAAIFLWIKLRHRHKNVSPQGLPPPSVI